MTEVSAFVKDLVEEEINHLEIGLVTQNPRTGKTVKITRGAFWGKYGLSNFWHWREVMEDGNLSEIEECGYGWSVENDRSGS